MVLVIPGVTYAREEEPASVASLRIAGLQRHTQMPHYSLDLLCVNRQIHDEAYNIFYHENELVFEGVL